MLLYVYTFILEYPHLASQEKTSVSLKMSRKLVWQNLIASWQWLFPSLETLWMKSCS